MADFTNPQNWSQVTPQDIEDAVRFHYLFTRPYIGIEVHNFVTNDGKVFLSDLSNPNAVFAPVFRPLPKVKGYSDIDQVNLYLKRIGTYVRLSYHLISLFNTPDQTLCDDHDVKLAAYRTEIIRQEAYDQIFRDRPKPDCLNNDEIWFLKKIASGLQMVYVSIQNLYCKMRDICFKHLTSTDDILYTIFNKAYSVLDAEEIHFRAEPHWSEYFTRLTEPYLKKIRSNAQDHPHYAPLQSPF